MMVGMLHDCVLKTFREFSVTPVLVDCGTFCIKKKTLFLSEWVISYLITNSVTSYLNISFKVQTCKKFNYDVELWKSNDILYEKKKVTQVLSLDYMIIALVIRDI